jgi:hypothetical protein
MKGSFLKIEISGLIQMYLIAKNKYRFDIPISLQRNHLLDIWHLDKAHWFTLCGVKVKEVFSKSSELVRFNLERFGHTQEVTIEQDRNVTKVNVNNCMLIFTIEEEKENHHFLNVEMRSDYRGLRLLWPIIQLVFLLTVIEDIIYYKKR